MTSTNCAILIKNYSRQNSQNLMQQKISLTRFNNSNGTKIYVKKANKLFSSR